jgi:ATP-dependent DNA helicase RecQ
LTIPTHKDFRTAEGLNRTRVITVALGLQRWAAMFKHADCHHLGNSKFRLRLDVSPGHAPDRIDIIGERSVQWNARTLTLMARAGLLRLTGGDADSGVGAAERAEGVFETIELLDPGHLNEDVWQRRVEPVRAAIAGARQRNLELMTRRLDDRTCPSDLVVELYGASRVDMACGGCRICRAEPSRRHPRALRREPASPWPAPLLPPTLAALLGEDRRLVVTYDPTANGAAQQRRAGQALDGMWRSGLRNLVLLGEPPELFSRGLSQLSDWPIFVARDGLMPRLPPGPQVLLIGPAHRWRRPNGPAGEPRVILLPVDACDPERLGERLLDRWSGPMISLDDLTRRVST